MSSPPLWPALSAGLIDPATIVIDSKSGVSGAGRSKAHVGYLFSEVDESLRPYNVGVHRHTPEIEQELSEIAGGAVRVSFTPHLVPMIRGILTTAYAALSRDASTDELIGTYRTAYSGSPFVTVLDEGEYPATKSVAGSNYCHISIAMASESMMAAFSVIDNLCKGGSGQAVQNMNVMFGLDEKTGLDMPGLGV